MAKIISKSLNPLWYAHSLMKGSRPILHDWNNFGSNLKQARKQSALRSTISTTPKKNRKKLS